MRALVPHLASLTVAAWLAASPAAEAVAPYDFDADGSQELVMGLPVFDGHGAAVVLPGSATGIRLQPQLLSPLDDAVPGDATTASSFGASVAGADFDGDGFGDLAVGDTFSHHTETAVRDVTLGSVTVLYGAPAGLGGARAQEFTGPELPDVDDSATYFGWALVAADLNADGFGDLVAGLPGDEPTDDEGDGGKGAIRVLFGSPNGLGEAGSVRLRARHLGEGLSSGSVLAVGDIDLDGHPDVFSAERGEEDNSDGDGRPGHVAYCPGTPAGPRRCDTLAKLGRDGLGPSSMGVGDVTGDGYPDAVLGMPYDRYDDDDGRSPKGAVVVWRGSSRGLRGKPLFISQETAGLPGRSTAGDQFGLTVAVGRIDGDKYADIVVGAPGEERDSGHVTVIRGGRAGHARGGHVVLRPGTAGIPETSRGAFGSGLTLLDHDGDGRLDLTIASPSARDGGSVLVLRGRRGTFDGTGAQAATLGRLGLAGPQRRLDPQLGRTDGSCCEPGGGAY